MTRSSVSALFLVAALAAPALAQPTPAPTPPAPEQPAPPRHAPPPVARLKPPPGWQTDDAKSGSIVRSLAQEPHFGGAGVGLDAQFLRSDPPGAVLVLAQVVTEAMPADPSAAASVELHAARDGADAVEGAKVVRWEVHVDPAGRVHEALLEWTDPSVGTTVVSRTLVFRTASDLARISAECVLGPDAGPLRAACEMSLASLAPNTTALEAMPVSATPPAAAAEAPAPGTTGTPTSAAPTIGDRDTPIPSTLLIRPPAKQTDRRPYYVVGGLLLLGLAYWWNRRERDKVAAADADPPDADKPDGEDRS